MTQVWQTGRVVIQPAEGRARETGRCLPQTRGRLQELSRSGGLRALRVLAGEVRRDRGHWPACASSPTTRAHGLPGREPSDTTSSRSRPDGDRGAPVAGPRGDRRGAQRLARHRAAAEVLPAIQAVAAAYDGVYLVGGAVRDVLLGEQSLDLDVMVEGDAIAFARELARELGRTLPPAREVPDRRREGRRTARARDPRRRRHARAPSSTARRARCPRSSARRCATTSRGATSRSTRWRPRCRPTTSAPPTTSSAATATCAEDRARAAQPQLRRGPDAPAARDPLRGAARLPHGRATRSRWRAAASTCGWSATCRRRACATSCSTCSPSRSVAAALERMAELGLDRALHPHLDAGPRAVQLVEAAGARDGRAPLAEARATARAARLPVRGDAGARGVRVARAAASCAARDQDVVAAAVTLAPAIAERLSGAEPPPPSELHELLDGQPLEVLVMAIVLAARAGRWSRSACAPTWSGCATCSLEITGDDLRARGRAGVARDRRRR